MAHYTARLSGGILCLSFRQADTAGETFTLTKEPLRGDANGLGLSAFFVDHEVPPSGRLLVTVTAMRNKIFVILIIILVNAVESPDRAANTRAASPDVWFEAAGK